MIEFKVLASGSQGNASIVRLGDDPAAPCVFVDLGLSPRRLDAAMEDEGVPPGRLRDAVLTHLDTDHCHRGWARALCKRDLTVHVHRRYQRAANRIGLPVRRLHFFDGDFEIAGTGIAPTFAAHDRLGSTAYVFERGGRRLGWATDLGRIPDGLYRSFTDLHAVAIESNYDRNMQMQSERPWFLKRRIMGGVGHLSNEQSLDAVRRLATTSPLGRIVLLHLSRECNTPDHVHRLYQRHAPHLLHRLVVSRQDRATDWIDVEPGPIADDTLSARHEQLALF